MERALRFQSVAALGALALAAPRLALAEPTDHGLTTVDPKTQSEVRTPEGSPAEAPLVEASKASVPQGGSTHVFDAYRLYSDSVTAQRMAGGAGSLIAGGTLIGAGFVVREHGSGEFGTFMIVMGGLGAVGGALAFVFPSEIESVANANGVYITTNPSPEQEAKLEKEWQSLANKSRIGRHVGSVISFVFSAAALVGGVVVLSSKSIDDETKSWVGPTLLVASGGMAAAGVATLLIESPTETSYAAFMATRAKGPAPSSSGLPNVRVSAQPLDGGGFIGLGTNF
jgi:hypothetical protein